MEILTSKVAPLLGVVGGGGVGGWGVWRAFKPQYLKSENAPIICHLNDPRQISLHFEANLRQSKKRKMFSEKKSGSKQI